MLVVRAPPDREEVTALTRERITLVQVTMLIVLSRVSLTLVYFGTPPVVKQDVWWQSFFSALLGLGFAWVLNHLWQRFPNQNFVQVAESVLGRPLGKVVSLLYLLFFALMLSLNLRLIGEFFVYAFLPRTPMMVVIGVVAILAAWVSRAGIEVISRAGQVIFPLLIGSILLIVGLLLKDIEFQMLLPLEILHTGPVPHLKDMISVAARTVELAWMGMLVPFVNQRRGLFGAVAQAQLWQGVVWVIMNIAIFGVLGRDIEHHYFPFYAAARLANVADFLERIDSLFLAVWLFGMFLRAAVMLWVVSMGSAQWLGLPDYRVLVFPLMGIAVTYSLAQAESFSEIQGYLAPEVFTPFSLTFVLMLPLLLLAVSAIRRAASGSDSSKQA